MDKLGRGARMNWKALVDQARPRVGMMVTRDGVLYTIAEITSGAMILQRSWREKPGSDLVRELVKLPYNGPSE